MRASASARHTTSKKKSLTFAAAASAMPNPMRTKNDDVKLALGLVGPGLVGKALLDQMRDYLPVLRETRGIDVSVLGIANSRKMLLSDCAMDLSNWQQVFNEATHPSDLVGFRDHLLTCKDPVVPVIVDCSASDHVSDFYKIWMESGVHVVTANKKVNSGPLERYQAVRSLQRDRKVHYFYETTVGAGLPVISTIKGLVDSGDRIASVEGVFSGTLSYLFNNFKAGARFSEIVAEAKASGYTEPDPRDDLSGTDVARKVANLARESGLELELSDIPVRSLVPKELESCETSEEFMRVRKLF